MRGLSPHLSFASTKPTVCFNGFFQALLCSFVIPFHGFILVFRDPVTICIAFP